jgi:hypothetical protein
MPLTAITLRNWRSFKEQRLELRPLTLIYGDNNAGKSALLRAVVALAEATHGLDGPLNWDGEVLRGLSFNDVRRQGIAAGESERLGWTLHGDDRWLSYEVDWFEPWREAVLYQAETFEGDRFEWVAKPEERGEQARTYRSGEETRRLEVHGFSLRGADEVEPSWPVLTTFLGEPCQWLRAGRKVPKITERSKRLKGELSVSGEGAVELLDHAPLVLEFVQRHFHEMTGYALELERVLPDKMFLRLNATLASAGRKANVSQLGDGVQGVIPVLTALGWLASEHKEAPSLLALEEPEAQLHPTSQRELGEAVCDALRLIKERGLERRLLVETHSEVLLMTLQLAIARGDIKPEEVAVYWVSQDEGTGLSVAKLLTVYENGTLGGLPRSAFRQQVELSGELLDAIPAVAPPVVKEVSELGRGGQR